MTPPLPPHDRRFAYVGVSLTKEPIQPRWGETLDRLQDELEAELLQSGYLEGAPFSWVTIAIRYGLNNDKVPSYNPISKKYGNLPLSIQVDTRELISCLDIEVYETFKKASLFALVHAGQKYNRPCAVFETMLGKMGGDGKDLISNVFLGSPDAYMKRI